MIISAVCQKQRFSLSTVYKVLLLFVLSHFNAPFTIKLKTHSQTKAAEQTRKQLRAFLICPLFTPLHQKAYRLYTEISCKSR